MADSFDVIVAGGGIAGLTAGLSSARLGRSTLVLTGGAPGGLLLSIDRIEGYPGYPDGIAGFELCPSVEEEAVAAGAEFLMAELDGLEADDGRWRVSTSEGDVAARAVVLATGAHIRELGVPGEERFRGKGVSHCASCDAPLLRDRAVAVVGGGDSALQEALTLAESAAAVVLLCRGDELSAQETYRRRVLAHPSIEVRHRTVVEEILGDDVVTGVRTRDLATGGVGELELAAVFAYPGLEPNTEALGGRLRLDDGGRVLTDRSLRTELPGVFAAGIVRSGGAGRAAAAAGDGATAAVAADGHLRTGLWPDETRVPAASVARGNGGSDG